MGVGPWGPGAGGLVNGNLLEDLVTPFPFQASQLARELAAVVRLMVRHRELPDMGHHLGMVQNVPERVGQLAGKVLVVVTYPLVNDLMHQRPDGAVGELALGRPVDLDRGQAIHDGIVGGVRVVQDQVLRVGIVPLILGQAPQPGRDPVRVPAGDVYPVVVWG